MFVTRFVLFCFQSIAIGYKRVHPSSIVVVQAFDARPSIRIKSSEQSSSFRKYRFVDAIQELDPVGQIGLLAPDFKVSFLREVGCFVF